MLTIFISLKSVQNLHIFNLNNFFIKRNLIILFYILGIKTHKFSHSVRLIKSVSTVTECIIKSYNTIIFT